MDDDVSWNSIAAAPEKEEEEDEADMPVVSRESRLTPSVCSYSHLVSPFGKNLLKRLSLPCVVVGSS